MEKYQPRWVRALKSLEPAEGSVVDSLFTGGLLVGLMMLRGVDRIWIALSPPDRRPTRK